MNSDKPLEALEISIRELEFKLLELRSNKNLSEEICAQLEVPIIKIINAQKSLILKISGQI